MDYEKQAEDFLKSCGVVFCAKKAFPQVAPRWAKDWKHGTQYSILLAKIENGNFLSYEELENRAEKSIQFFFWNSIHKKEEATHGKSDKHNAYDVLSGVYYPVSSFEEFCSSFGYSEDSREAYQTYQEVVELNRKIESIFTAEELEKLQEIQ